jgi:hypothetical protein
MNESNNLSDLWLVRIKNVVEILAILGAGIWALWTFGLKDAPVLTTRISIEDKMEWEAPSDDSGICFGNYHVVLKNIGITPVSLVGATVGLYEFPVPRLNGRAAMGIVPPPVTDNDALAMIGTGIKRNYVNDLLQNRLKDQPPKLSSTEGALEDQRMVGTYAAGESDRMTFTFLVKDPEPGRTRDLMILMKVYSLEDEEPWQYWKWIDICGQGK